MELERIKTLPADRKELEVRWPRLLADIIRDIRSPADPQALAADLERDARFKALVDGWDRMPTTAQARAWEMIQERLWETVRRTRTFCVRCGECCRRGSPVLFDQDRPTLADGFIRRRDLVALRRGEKAFSNREQKLVVLEREQVKLKEAPDGRTCLFLGPGGDACLIYPHRPFQCRIMECWDPSRFDTILKLPPLTRLDLLGRNNPLAPIMDQHDRRCAPALIDQLLNHPLESDPAVEDQALDLVLFDLHLREFVQQKFAVAQEEMDFFFGRPLALLIRSFGYEVRPDSDNRLRVVRLESHDKKSSHT